MTLGWKEFAAQNPEISSAGQRLLTGEDGVAIGFLATSLERPGLSPVCPVFSGGQLYLIAAARSQKVTHLRDNSFYTLHAFLGPEDEEFQISGAAVEVTETTQRENVQNDIPFPSFGVNDPIFELRLDRALWVRWKNFGTPNMQAQRTHWRAPSS